MIGLVNTPDGQRIKIVRNESIGKFSWDTSAPEVNEGQGINDWHQADLMILLNDFYYNSKENQTCYIGQNNESKPCSFDGSNESIRGLKYVHDLIEEITWTIGNYADGYDGRGGTPKNWYNHERSSYENRNSEWQGKVGLIYTSDKGYSSAGTGTVNQDTCWETSVYANYYDQCKQSAYLMSNSSGWILSIRPNFQQFAFVDTWGDDISSSYVVFPTLYLKTDTIVLSNEIGSQENPYVLA